MKQLSLFTDTQMALFGVRTPTARRGRASTVDGNYGFVPSKTMYAVETVDPGFGAMIDRIFTVPMPMCQGKMQVEVSARRDERRGLGFGLLMLTDRTGKRFYFTVDGQNLRNMASALNAAANSTGAVWRK